MTANNDFPILDGVAPSWADIIVRITPDGAPLIDMKDIAAINSNSTVEVGVQRSAGGRIMRTTTGQPTAEASFTLYRSGYQKLLRALKNAAVAKGYMRGNVAQISRVHFGVQVQHTPDGDTEVYEYRIKGCRVLGRDLNGAEGTDADQVEVSLHTKDVVDVIDGVEVAPL